MVSFLAVVGQIAFFWLLLASMLACLVGAWLANRSLPVLDGDERGEEVGRGR